MTHDTPPKRIWVIPDASGVKHEWHSGWYQGRPNGRHRVEYILASEVDAMVAAASQGAAVAVSERADWPEDDRGRTLHPELFARVATVILGLIPQPAAAALDKLIREAEARGMERAQSLARRLANDSEREAERKDTTAQQRIGLNLVRDTAATLESAFRAEAAAIRSEATK